MTARSFKRLLFLTLSLSCALPVSAAPVLRPEIVVNSDVVTVGDMFDGADSLAEQALFRAPAAGTAGLVDIQAVRNAAALAGLSAFSDAGLLKVRVSRAATAVDEPMLTKLMEADLRTRGVVTGEVTVLAAFDGPVAGINAAATTNPVQLLNLRYQPGNGVFAARFTIAGRTSPLDITGRIDLMLPAPHLVASLAAGTVLQPQDIEMRPEPISVAQGAGAPGMAQLVGKQLQHQSYAGMLLHAADVAEPQLIARNDSVIVYLRAGAMTLSVKGQALNAASLGEPVAVLNMTSKKVLHGTALAAGEVQMPTNPTSTAGL
jgi:flagella basal body P-ring formation protein FlgA